MSTTIRSAPVLAPAVWLTCLLGACAGATGWRAEAGVTPGSAEERHHPVLAPSCVVDLRAGAPGMRDDLATPDAGQAPARRIPIGATVFFRNADPDHFVELAVSGDFQSCAGCVTVTNFTCLESGAHAAAIEPGGMSTLCFHKAGRYPFRASGGTRPLVGFLEVFDPASAKESAGGKP